MKDDKETNYFRTMFWKCLLPKKSTTKTQLFNGKRYTKKLYTEL